MIDTIARHRIEEMIFIDEGGWKFTDHPDDPDVGTYGGVRYKFFARYWKKKFGNKLTLAEFKMRARRNDPDLQAEIIVYYYTEYYLKASTEKIKYTKLAVAHFSVAVNFHPKTAIRFLQKAINDMSSKKVVKIDGVFGRKTKIALEKAMTMNGVQGDRIKRQFKDKYCDRWFEGYARSAQRSPRKVTFIWGWYRRSMRYRDM